VPLPRMDLVLPMPAEILTETYIQYRVFVLENKLSFVLLILDCYVMVAKSQIHGYLSVLVTPFHPCSESFFVTIPMLIP